MEHIIARQNAAAKPVTGKAFLLGIAQIILELTIAQVIVNLLIKATGIGLLNLLFYLFAVVLLVRFMTHTVAGSIYTLRSETLVLQRMLGDSTVLGVEIPLEKIVSIRPYAYGERLYLDYRQVTYVDMQCAPGLRMRAAFLLSLVWAWLARMVAGKKAARKAGFVIIYLEDKKRRACAFRPDDEFAKALEAACPDAFGVDERLALKPADGYFAQSLRRAFRDLYPHVPGVVTPEELRFEREEFARRKEAKIEKAAKKKEIPLNEYKAQLKDKERRKAAAQRKRKVFFRALPERFAALVPAKRKNAGYTHGTQEVPEREEKENASRRRRGRQE